MIVLAGGDLVLPTGIVSGASLVIEGERITAVTPGARADSAGAQVIEVAGCYVVPGFIDVHVHGVDGHDALDEGGAVAHIASRLPRYGVTAFCPTTVACGPAALKTVLAQVATARTAPIVGSARVLPAHLESNFINPDYRGAQPAEYLRVPVRPVMSAQASEAGSFSAQDILDVIGASRSEVGIVTLAPELPGAIALIRALASAGHRVSLGHSGANMTDAVEAMDAGARQSTHLFNRMPPMSHRAPGLAGAALTHDEVTAELICDGYHVHPAMARVAIASKGVGRLMAITDGTAGSGLAIGSSARLGGQRIRVTEHAAFLDDGTLAGSTLTMDRAFRTIVTVFGCSVPDAVMLCSTTPARTLGLAGFGALVEGAFADVVVLDRSFRVVRTFIAGRDVYTAAPLP